MTGKEALIEHVAEAIDRMPTLPDATTRDLCIRIAKVAVEAVEEYQTKPRRDFKPKFMNGTGYGPDD